MCIDSPCISSMRRQIARQGFKAYSFMLEGWFCKDVVSCRTMLCCTIVVHRNVHLDPVRSAASITQTFSTQRIAQHLGSRTNKLRKMSCGNNIQPITKDAVAISYPTPTLSASLPYPHSRPLHSPPPLTVQLTPNAVPDLMHARPHR